MNAGHRLLPPVLIAAAALIVLLGTFSFALLHSGYSHSANTISELGETGAPYAHSVDFGFFLPVGLLVWLALWLSNREMPDKNVSIVLAALSCLGTGYVMSAFFPCDTGAPIYGSWCTQVHNVFGFVDYEGTGIGFLLAARLFAKRRAFIRAIGFSTAGGLVLVGLVMLSMDTHLYMRGLVQRITELIQFTGVFFACLLLPQKTRAGTFAPAPDFKR